MRNPFLRSALLFLAHALPAAAINIAGSGSGYMGAGDTGISTVNYHHNGELAHICDGNPATRVDNFHGSLQDGHTMGHAGVVWPAARTESVKSITVTMATFYDGGWFGSRECPPPGGTLTPAMLKPAKQRSGAVVEPYVEVNFGPNGSGSWVRIASSNDYVASFTGHTIPSTGGIATSRSFTVTLRERPVGITGIRVAGPMGGAHGSGYIGVYEIAVEADPVVDVDNDKMDDAWEAANGLNVGVNDADTTSDGDNVVNLNEFIWRTNPQLPDSDGDGLADGSEGMVAGAPNTWDTDGDGLSDGAEYNGTYGTMVSRADSDGDGLSDRMEIETTLTNPVVAFSDNDDYDDGSEIALGTDPLNTASRLPNMARSARATLGRNFWSPGSSTYLQAGGTPISNGGNASRINDLDLNTLAHTSGNSRHESTTSNASHAGIVLANDLPVGVTFTRIEITFATYGTGGWFGQSGPAPGTALTAAHLTVPELQYRTYSGGWTRINATTDYLTRMTGHVIGTSTVPTRRSVVFTLNTPVRGNGLRLAGAHRNFLAVYEVAVSTSRDTGDTDADGLSDAEEATRGTSTIYSDTDEDGLSDHAEVNLHNTDPLVADSDGDSFQDGHEVHVQTNPLVAASLPAGPLIHLPAPNLARLATGLIGTRSTDQSTPGIDTSVVHAGTLANIIDENPVTRVDSWNGGGSDAFSYAGAHWGSTNPQTVAMLKVRFATFINGGWFGPTNVGPASGGLLTAAHLEEPVVQVRYGNDTLWTTVPHSSDYLASLLGHKIGDGTSGGFFSTTVSPTATFILNTPATNVSSIRLLGREGGNAEGFLGIFDFAAYPVVYPAAAVSDPDTDNDGLPDAWEIEKFGNLTAQDAGTDSDHDGSNALLEYAFNLNPHAFDRPPSAVLEGGYLTLTLTKRPLVNYLIQSGGNLQDFSGNSTTILIDNATTLKARDNFAIGGPATRRFLRATVTAP